MNVGPFGAILSKREPSLKVWVHMDPASSFVCSKNSHPERVKVSEILSVFDLATIHKNEH